MADVGVVHDACPECDVVVPMTIQIKDMKREGNTLIVDLEPDLTDVTAHAWTHET